MSLQDILSSLQDYGFKKGYYKAFGKKEAVKD
jgi:hypothetical protein